MFADRRLDNTCHGRAAGRDAKAEPDKNQEPEGLGIQLLRVRNGGLERCAQHHETAPRHERLADAVPVAADGTACETTNGDAGQHGQQQHPRHQALAAVDDLQAQRHRKEGHEEGKAHERRVEQRRRVDVVAHERERERREEAVADPRLYEPLPREQERPARPADGEGRYEAHVLPAVWVSGHVLERKRYENCCGDEKDRAHIIHILPGPLLDAREMVFFWPAEVEDGQGDDADRSAADQGAKY